LKEERAHNNNPRVSEVKEETNIYNPRVSDPISYNQEGKNKLQRLLRRMDLMFR
jgi:hypothetical protein